MKKTNENNTLPANSKRRGNKELRDVAIALAHGLVACEGWKTRYEKIEQALILEKIKTLKECANTFKAYRNPTVKGQDIYAYDQCELYCLGLAEELRGGLK